MSTTQNLASGYELPLTSSGEAEATAKHETEGAGLACNLSSFEMRECLSAEEMLVKSVQSLYHICMKFGWDEEKSKSNKLKHGIQFEAAKDLPSPHPLEKRNIIIGGFQNKLWTAIYTMRDDTIRIISVRWARKRRLLLYEEEGVG